MIKYDMDEIGVDSMEIQIDIWRCLTVLIRKSVYIVLVCALVFIGSYYTYSGSSVNRYAASSSVYSAAENVYSYDQVRQMIIAMQQYTTMATSQKVLSNAAELMGYMEGVTGKSLSGMVTATFNNITSMVNIEATSTSPRVAMSAANAVATAFTAELLSLTGRNSAQVLDVATTYRTVYNARTQKWKSCIFNTAVAGAAMCLYILIKEILSKKVTSLSAVSLNGSLDVLGVIPVTEAQKDQKQ